MEQKEFWELLSKAGLNKRKFAELVGIPYFTVIGWGNKVPYPPYTRFLLEAILKIQTLEKVVKAVEPLLKGQIQLSLFPPRQASGALRRRSLALLSPLLPSFPFRTFFVLKPGHLFTLDAACVSRAKSNFSFFVCCQLSLWLSLIVDYTAEWRCFRLTLA